MLGYVPASLIAVRLVPRAGVVSLLWLLGIAAAALWLMRFRCPRCGERFVQRGRNRLLFSGACLTCGVRIGERAEE